jgi:hypothetical protein
VKETCHSKAFQYKEIRNFNRFTGEEILSSTAVEMLWNCPPPNLGPVVVTVNLRLRNEKVWKKLTYSLKESPIRMNAGDDEDEVNGEDGERYLFDQEERHDVFWSFIREQNWDAVESFFEKKVDSPLLIVLSHPCPPPPPPLPLPAVCSLLWSPNVHSQEKNSSILEKIIQHRPLCVLLCSLSPSHSSPLQQEHCGVQTPHPRVAIHSSAWSDKILSPR